MSRLGNLFLALLFSVCGPSLSVQAGVIFSASFDAANGTLLHNTTPNFGSNWNVTAGASRLRIQGGAVDTTTSPAATTLAFSNFTRALGSRETLSFSFTTGEPTGGNFLSRGWAGLSLYTGGSGGTEQFFFGSVATHEKWGISGAAVNGNPQLFNNIISASQSVAFSYVYDTGAWTYTVGSETMSGTTSSGLAFNTVRIGAGEWNNIYANIKVLDMQVAASQGAAVPEPSACVIALMGIAYGGYSKVRARKRHKSSAGS